MGRKKLTDAEKKERAARDLAKLSVSQVKQAHLYAEIERDSLEMIAQLKEQAKRGNTIALKMLVDRILPPKKYNNITFQLNGALRNVPDIIEAMSTVIEYVADGKISPEQGKFVADLLQIHKDIILSNELDERLKRIEQALSIESSMTDVNIVDID